MSESNLNNSKAENSSNNKMNDIVNLKCLIKNLDIKLSAVSCAKNQILCVVLKNNDVLLRYVSEAGDLILKKLNWFQKNSKIVQDICFDPSGTWLLVFCEFAQLFSNQFFITSFKTTKSISTNFVF